MACSLLEDVRIAVLLEMIAAMEYLERRLIVDGDGGLAVRCFVWMQRAKKLLVLIWCW